MLHVCRVATSSGMAKIRSEALFIIPGLTSGGAERVLTSLANYFVQQGGGASIFPWYNNEEPFYSLDSRVRIHTRGETKRPNRVTGRFHVFWLNLIAIRQVMQNNESPFVISFLPETNCLTLLAGVGLGKKILISERNLLSRRRVSIFWRILRRLTYRHANAVIINNEENRKILRRYVDPARIVNIPNPVILSATPVILPQRRRNLVVAMGRLVSQKNYDVLLNEFINSGIIDHGWRLEIIGDGPEYEKISSSVKDAGLSRYIKLIGEVRDPWDKYQDASLFMMTSDFEGMPNALLEALACGVIPIVTQSVGDLGVKIASVDPNLVVSAKCKGAIAGSLREIALDTGKRRRYSERMVDLARPHSIDVIAGKWEALLHNIRI
jgi:GalNAc-alpha-(1->4)-GalNAc-alpha-(1->3)-diNAcBac-PP-undecaprenol alpha-1,4-N-acetyl-D-galactosaminyltransferase